MSDPQYQISDWVPVLNKNGHYSKYDIGEYSYGVPYIYSYGEPVKLTIGKFCSIGGGVKMLLGAEHRTEYLTTYPFANFFPFAHRFTDSHPKPSGDIIIGNDVWIGEEAMILSGVTIGDGAVVGARALIASNIDPYSIVVGNPAKHHRYRFDLWIIEELMKIKWWDWPIEKIAEAMPLMLSEDIAAFVERYRV